MNLSGEEVQGALYCCNELIDRRARAGIPVPVWMTRLAGHLNLAALVSDTGQEIGSDPTSLETQDLIGSVQAARLLGISPRQLQRLAADLDGQKICGRWAFQAQVVREYAQARVKGGDDGRHRRRVQAAPIEPE